MYKDRLNCHEYLLFITAWLLIRCDLCICYYHNIKLLVCLTLSMTITHFVVANNCVSEAESCIVWQYMRSLNLCYCRVEKYVLGALKSIILRFETITYILYIYACGTKNTFLQYFLEILKRPLQNFYKILKKCFLVIGSS